jgi:hypothetical protein
MIKRLLPVSSKLHGCIDDTEEGTYNVKSAVNSKHKTQKRQRNRCVVYIYVYSCVHAERDHVLCFYQPVIVGNVSWESSESAGGLVRILCVVLKYNCNRYITGLGAALTKLQVRC